MEIYPNVHLVPGVRANPYLIIEPDGLTLIDTGLPGSEKKILKYVQELGLTPDKIRNIIITHSDFDHIGSLASLKSISGAKVYASAIEAEAIAAGHASRQIKPKNIMMRLLFSVLTPLGISRKVRIDNLLVDGQIIAVLGGLQVIETPGHTPGHISLFLPAAGILFTGDSIVSEKDKLFGSREAVTWDRQKAIESVHKQARLGARIVCSGHGPVVTEAGDKFPV
jgi:glyoxylase-like metal-dependent hydrolase (beta-lactamase superfamily II)